MYSKDGQQSVEVDPVAARAIRTLLIDLYLRAGMGTDRVGEEMNRRGLKTSRGLDWSRTSVYHVLNRLDAYAGYVVLNRRSKRREMVRTRGQHEPIITRDEYEMLRAEVAARAVDRGKRKPIYSGVVVCGICGRIMTACTERRTYRSKKNGEMVRYEAYYLRCSGSYEDRSHSLLVSEKNVDRAVRAAISRLQEMADLSEYADQANESRREVLGERMAAVRQVIASLSAQRNRVTDLYVAHGVIRIEEYMARIEDIDRQIADAEAELVEVERYLTTVDFEEDRVSRIERLRNSGIELLDQAEEMPGLVRQWLRDTLIIYANRHPTKKRRSVVTRIEFC